MNDVQIYQRIKELAEQLSRKGMTYTRADLAYELEGLGVKGDSLQLSEWVWKAYTYYKEDERIRKAFVNNEKKRYIVDEFRIYPVAEQGDMQELSGRLEETLDESRKALHALERSIAQALRDETVKAAESRIVKTIVGTKGVSDVQATASAVFQGYTDMVDAYDTAKGEVKAVISDFVGLRNQVNEIYCKYALALTDIFGDSIRSVSPRLFDFDTIQYLDVQEMLQNVQLAYDQVMEKCGELMGSISENFSTSVKSASGMYRQAGNKKVGLMLAGVEMLSHYLDAGQRTNELRGQLLSLKNNVKHDATLIKGDMGRLLLLYKGMNDYHIPRAEAFYRYSRQLMESDLNRLIESLYRTPKLAALKQQRDCLLERHKELNRILTDSQLNMEYYTAHIAECEATIGSMRSAYTEAKRSKPSKPFFLWNLLSLGSLSKRYNREVTEWYQSCQPVITQYEELQVDINLDKEDMTAHRKAYKEAVEEMKELNRKLQQSSRDMQQALHADKETKKKIAARLDTLIKLLRVAKEIAETKPDDRLTNAVVIADYRNEKLPVEITKGIQRFAQTLDNLQSDSTFARRSLDELGNGEAGDYSEEELQTVTEAQNAAIRQAADLFKSWTTLQEWKMESRITAKKHDEELRKLQAQFRNDMQTIDNQSEVLRQALKQINLSQDDRQLKEGLLALADKQPDTLTDQEWEEFFNGNKTIEI